MEILDRHSADLAVLVASDKGDLAQNARNLLTKATDAATRGSALDDATIENALQLLGQACCNLPPSMQGFGPAATTVLESLRGKTLKDGLTAASRTIRPRFQAIRK